MIGNDLELDIITLYADDLTAGFTILQISKLLKKAYPYINKKSNEFISEGIFRKTVVGKSYLCRLNLASNQTRILLALIEMKKLESRLIQDPKTEALISELKLLRQDLGILSAVEIDKQIVIIGENLSPYEIQNKAPLLASMNFSIATQNEFRRILSKKSASQVFLGFEIYFTLAAEALEGSQR
ncbi:MAG: hypothetical protein AABX51_01540 [Nanoarchaeota archaeon]